MLSSSRTRKHLRIWESVARAVLSVVAICAITSSPAYANVGVPMLMVVWPAAWVLLIPIILIEAVVACKVIKLSWRRALKIVGKANLVSTLVGIPVTWLILFLLQIAVGGAYARGIATPWLKVYAVTVQSPWLIPYEGTDLYWMPASAAAVLCVPFFFMSVWCENRVARRYFSKEEWPLVLRWAWRANALSYGMILILLIISLIVAMLDR